MTLKLHVLHGVNNPYRLLGVKNSNAFYWYQIFALDSAVVEVQEMFSSHGGLLTNAMYHHGETF